MPSVSSEVHLRRSRGPGTELRTPCCIRLFLSQRSVLVAGGTGGRLVALATVVKSSSHFIGPSIHPRAGKIRVRRSNKPRQRVSHVRSVSLKRHTFQSPKRQTSGNPLVAKCDCGTACQSKSTASNVISGNSEERRTANADLSPKDTVSLPCDSAESSHSIGRAHLPDPGARR
jgi:hypothetical protein